MPKAIIFFRLFHQYYQQVNTTPQFKATNQPNKVVASATQGPVNWLPGIQGQPVFTLSTIQLIATAGLVHIARSCSVFSRFGVTHPHIYYLTSLSDSEAINKSHGHLQPIKAAPSSWRLLLLCVNNSCFLILSTVYFEEEEKERLPAG